MLVARLPETLLHGCVDDRTRAMPYKFLGSWNS